MKSKEGDIMKRERGFILITSLLIMGALAAFGIAFYITSSTNTLVASNEIRGEELHYLAESGARMAIAIYKEETGPVKIVSWKDVSNQPEDNFKTLITEPVEDATFVGMYNDSNPSVIEFLGKAIRKKKGSEGGFITRKILVNAIPIASSPTPSPTPSSTPGTVVNSGHRKAIQKLQDAINNANPGDTIIVVQTSKEDREGGDPIVIDKPVHIVGVYKPTSGYSGDGISGPRTLIRKPIIINASNVSIEGLWIDPVEYEDINDDKLQEAEDKTGCYVDNPVNGVHTDNPFVDCSGQNGFPVPRHKGAGILIRGNDVRIANNVIARGKGSYDAGIYVFPDSQGVLIEHNTFVDTTDVENVENECDPNNKSNDPEDGNTAIVVNNINQNSYVTIVGNIFAYSKCDYSIGIEVLGERGGNVKDGEHIVQCVENDFWNNTLAIGNAEGFGVYGLNPEFSDWEHGILTLSDESPVKAITSDGEDFGVAYDSPIFRDLTIVDWDHEEYFESLAEALMYATDKEKIRIDKVIPVDNRFARAVEGDPITDDVPILPIYPNELEIYSTKGPCDDTKVPLFVDVIGDNIKIDGIKFQLDDRVLQKFDNVTAGLEGVGVINLAAAPLMEEDPGDFYKHYWHHNCWMQCMVDCVKNNLAGDDTECGNSGHRNKNEEHGKNDKHDNQNHHNNHHSACGCLSYCMEHYKDYCTERKGIIFALSNSIIVRPGEKEFGDTSDPQDYRIAGISGGYLEEATLTNVVITSLGEPAYGDGIRFINKGSNCYHSWGCWIHKHGPHRFLHYGRGKFVVSNSIITGYIQDTENNNSNTLKKSKKRCNNGDSFDVVGVNASFTDRTCSSCWSICPHHGEHHFGNWSCNVIEENGACGCGTYKVCELPSWNPFPFWGESVTRKITITNSDIWGNTCDIKYDGPKNFKCKHCSEGTSDVDYSNIVGMDPGFRFGVTENEMFRINPPLSDCNCSFNMGIDWDKFTQ